MADSKTQEEQSDAHKPILPLAETESVAAAQTESVAAPATPLYKPLWSSCRPQWLAHWAEYFSVTGKSRSDYPWVDFREEVSDTSSDEFELPPKRVRK